MNPIDKRAQEKFHIPADAMGTTSYPRNHTALLSPMKAEFLIMELASMCHGTLPADGRSRRFRRDASHVELASGSGLSRETWTRRMSRLSGRERSREGQRLKLKAQQRVKQPLLGIQRRPGRTNRYEPRLPAREGRKAHCFYYATNEQLLKHPEWSQYFDRELLWDDEAARPMFHGNADVDNWIWHPAFEASDTARLVLSVLVMMGLKKFGVIKPWQGTIARRCGISRKTVRAALRELERLGAIRVLGTAEEVNGQWFRRKNKIVYLPWYELTAEGMREMRRQRLQARREAHKQRTARRRVLRQRDLDEAQRRAAEQKRFWLAMQFCRASRLYDAALQAHVGQSVRLNTLLAAVRAELLKAGVDARVIGALVLRIEAPPPPAS